MPEPRTCPGCGATFTPTVHRTTYCGRSCAAATHAARKDRVIADVEVLIGSDSAENLSARLGYRNAKSLRGVLRDWGRQDLADALDREPVGHVPSGRIVGGWVLA